MRAKLLGVGTGIGLVLVATAAIAHPKLTSSVPAADGTEHLIPKEIRLSFSEGIIAKFSGLELQDERGKSVTTGSPAVNPTDKKQLVVPLHAPLAAGKYRVIWHAVSDDTHRVKGEYTFTVGN